MTEEMQKCARLFQDPDWVHVEKLLKAHIEKLKELHRVDLSQPADTVKAEVKGRLEAWRALQDFLIEANAIKKSSTLKPDSFR